MGSTLLFVAFKIVSKENSRSTTADVGKVTSYLVKTLLILYYR